MPPFREVEFTDRVQRLVRIIDPGELARSFSPDVVRHIHMGFWRRLNMLQRCITTLSQLPEDGSDPPPVHQLEDADVDLTAMYVILRGGLDNLAWALVHHYRLLDQANEDNHKHRVSTDLLRATFLKSLGAKDPELAKGLEKFEVWGRELADLRDPAAHRVPLYIPPSILTVAEAEKRQKMLEDFGDAMASGSRDLARELNDAAYGVGRFRRIVVLSGQWSIRLFRMDPLLDRDLDSFLSVSELVLRLVFFPGSRDRWCYGPALPQRTY